jgi:hypothetical protein
MSRILAVLGVLTMLIGVSAASAEVTLTAPTEGQTVGPSTSITGRCSQRAFVVVITDVNLENGESLGSVPGIRHWTNDDNSISVRISTPRLFTQPNEKLTYIIHVKAYSSAEMASAAPDLGETQVTCYSK